MSADAEPLKKKVKTTSKPMCPYGKKCYRKNPCHFEEFAHPRTNTGESDSSSDDLTLAANIPIQIDTSKLKPCPFGTKCYRKNLIHFAEFSHPVSADGASTSKVVPDDSETGSDTDVYDSDQETDKLQKEQRSKMQELVKRGSSLVKRYSLMSEEERKDLIKKAFEMKKHLEEELAATKKVVEEKESAILKMQDEINKGVLMMDGEKEALEKEEVRYFSLMPERNYKEGSAAQTHFRLAESQFYRLLSGGMSSTYQVKKVDYVVNPKLVKQFNEAREEMRLHRGEECSHPILAFHGTVEESITAIVETGFRIPGVDDPTLKHRTGNKGFYGRGIYFSEFTAYSMGYVAGASKILLSKVLPGKVFQPEGLILGHPLKDGYDSHMSPCKKELVMFHSERILPCYIVHYSTVGGEFKYKKPVDERRKAKSKDELMKLYWKAQKRPKSTIFSYKNIAFAGEFADDTTKLEDLVTRHGGTANYVDPSRPAAPAPRGRGRGRARGRVAGPIGFQYLVTNEDVFQQVPQHCMIGQGNSFKAAVVREEFLYDSIIEKKLLDSDDYEFD